MAGLGRFLSSAMRGLVDGLEAGTEEGVRMEVEKIREELREKEVRVERERVETERLRIEQKEKKERERVGAERVRVAEEQTMEKQKIEEERQKEEERIRAEKQERDEKNAFWTTPGLRPLAEPPILDWDRFFRVLIPSDLRYKALYPNDPEKTCRVKDLHGELEVILEYEHCAGMLRDDAETGSGRRKFYRHLLDDIMEDRKEVHREYGDIHAMATDFSQFQFKYLDNDGRTTRLEEWIKKGADVFCGRGDEVREKYSYLVPRDFVENCLATFEFVYAFLDGGPGWIINKMSEGHDVLEGWPQEVQYKYGHLRQNLPQHPLRTIPSYPQTNDELQSRTRSYSPGEVQIGQTGQQALQQKTLMSLLVHQSSRQYSRHT